MYRRYCDQCGQEVDKHTDASRSVPLNSLNPLDPKIVGKAHRLHVTVDFGDMENDRHSSVCTPCMIELLHKAADSLEQIEKKMQTFIKKERPHPAPEPIIGKLK